MKSRLISRGQEKTVGDRSGGGRFLWNLLAKNLPGSWKFLESQTKLFTAIFSPQTEKGLVAEVGQGGDGNKWRAARAVGVVGIQLFWATLHTAEPTAVARGREG